MSQNNKSPPAVMEDVSVFLNEWGFTLKDLYNMAVTFFKDKEGKAVHFSYEERMKLLGLMSQVVHGKLDPETAPPVGVLDVIGKDRRLAWQAIGDKSKPDSMFEFITTLNKQCPLFKPYVEAHKRDNEEKTKALKIAEHEELKQHGDYQLAQEIQRQADEEKQKIEDQKRRVQDALNSQTFSQFKAYAEQQFPGNPEQQGVLIRQLQEQHYEQYMRQIYQQKLFTDQTTTKSYSEDTNINSQNANLSESPTKVSSTNENIIKSTPDDKKTSNSNKRTTSLGDEEGAHAESDKEGSEDNSSVAAASMWTRKDIKEFKESVRAEGGEAIIRIGQGESVTVRVPTHEDGTCLFWEFATDSYDIGFGLFFEWTNADEPVSVQVTEENTSDEEEEDDEAFAQLQQDVEKGRELLPKGAKPNTDVIIPVYRRDAHLEVYVGSHLFPGKGVYLLKFDNSYSFWRSKTLYYRVYYTK